MSTKNDGGPAFPRPVSFSEAGRTIHHGTIGMSLRDWFAGQALAAMTADPDYSRGPSSAAIADRAYVIADYMLAARVTANEGKTP